MLGPTTHWRGGNHNCQCNRQTWLQAVGAVSLVMERRPQRVVVAPQLVPELVAVLQVQRKPKSRPTPCRNMKIKS